MHDDNEIGSGYLVDKSMGIKDSYKMIYYQTTKVDNGKSIT